MKNGDMPASPIFNATGYASNPCAEAIYEGSTAGLTKREHFAAMAMQGYCAHKQIGGEHHDSIAEYSVQTADALLDALEKEI